MNGKDFTEWRERMGFNRTQAAEALGLGRNMPQRYEDGETEIPLYIALACEAIESMRQAADPNMIEVFSFQVYDVTTDTTITPKNKRPRDFIEHVARGVIIEGTGEFVPRDALDQDERLTPEAAEKLKNKRARSHLRSLRNG